MNTPLADTTPIYSSLGADPDLGELVEMFVDEMPARISSLVDAANADDTETLHRTAHQLKGSAGSYGFDQITPFATSLESALDDNKTEEEILASLEAVVDICSRVRAGAPD